MCGWLFEFNFYRPQQSNSIPIRSFSLSHFRTRICACACMYAQQRLHKYRSHKLINHRSFAHTFIHILKVSAIAIKLTTNNINFSSLCAMRHWSCLLRRMCGIDSRWSTVLINTHNIPLITQKSTLYHVAVDVMLVH